MSTTSVICTIWAIHLLSAISPGPAFLVVARTSMSHSSRAGIATAVGLGTGTMALASVGLLSSGALLQLQAESMGVIRVLCGSYLVYLGISYWFGDSLADEDDLESQIVPGARSDLRAFTTGFIVNLFNPKVVLLFVSLFTTVLSPMTPVWVRCIIILLLVTLNAMAWYSAVAVFLSSSAMQSRYRLAKLSLDRLFGSLLVVCGLWLARRV